MLIFIVLPHCGIRSKTLLPDTTSSHIILTPERPVLALPENPSAKRGATSTIVNDFGMSRPGIEPDTFRSRSALLPDTTSSHIILTPERPVLALPENPSAKRGATSTIVNDFGMSRPGIEPDTFRSRSGHSTY